MDVLARKSQPFGATFVEVLRWRASHHPDKTACTFLLDGETREERYTYADLDERARLVAALLQEHLAVGDRVLLLYPPGLEYIAAIFGCWYAGVVAVPAYPPRLNQNLARIESIIHDADAHFALTTPAILSSLQRKFTDDPLVHGLRWLVPEQESMDLAERWNEYLPDIDVLALLQYTSGSTGKPKGVMITHDNLIQNAIIIQKSMGLDSQIVCVSWLPAYHDMGLMGQTLEPLYLGGSSILMAPASFLLQPVRWLQAISYFKANTSGAPNFAFNLCVDKATPEILATLDLSSWDMAFVGSEPIRAETLERFYQTFAPCGFRKEALYPCYGMAEATLFISGGLKQEPPIVRHFARETLEQNRPLLVSEHYGDAYQLVGCGKPLQEQQILIVDPVSRVVCASQQVGEIWVASPNVAQGYWRKPQETQETFQAYLKESQGGPFLRTGDMGFFSEGEMFVTGRLKELIIIRGQNYYPQDIENAAELSHRALRRNCSAAFSIEVDGEERVILVMEIERQHRHSEPQEIFAAIRQAVMEESNLHVYAIVLIKPGSMLKTSSGKIQRRACHEAFLAQTFPIIFADLPRPVSELVEQRIDVGAKITEPVSRITQRSQVDAMRGQLEISSTPEKIQEEQNVISNEQGQSLLLQLYQSSQSQQVVLLEQYIQQQIAQVLERSAKEISSVLNIRNLGLDSLMVVNIINNCQRDLSITLDVRQFYECTSFRSIALYIAKEFNRVQQNRKEDGFTREERLLAQPRERQAVFPLSFVQQRLWFLHQLDPYSAAYNVLTVLRIKGELVIEALEWSLKEIIQRHESLRTSFTTYEEQPVQVIHETTAFTLSRIELNHLTAKAGELEMHRLARLEGLYPFDLTQGPLIRSTLLSLNAQEYVLLFTCHHIVTDGWSIGILLRELQTLYQAHIAGQSSPLAELAVQYADFAVWQRRWLGSPIDAEASQAHSDQESQQWNEERKQTQLEKQLAYWKTQLAGPLPMLELPTDYPRPLVQTFRGAHLLFHLPEQLIEDLNELSKREGVTLFMTLLASFQVLLARYSGQRDILVGTPIAGRNRPEIEHVIGCFVNTLVLRTNLSGNPSFRELLQRVRDVCLGAYVHQETPFEQIVEVLHPERDVSRYPLFQVMFELQHASWWLERELPGASLQQLPTESGVSIFDLTWSVTSRGSGEIEYSTDLFSAATIERLLGHWQILLQSIVATPQLPISALPFLSLREREQLVIEWNQTQSLSPAELCLHQLVAAQAYRTPDRIALSFQDEQLSYAQLEQHANRLACLLQAGGVGPESLIALFARRSIPLAVGILAVFKAGGAYLPLDPTLPQQRLSQILTDAQPHVLLTTRELVQQMPLAGSIPWFCMETGANAESFSYRSSQESSNVGPQQLSYVIYTSGSTGQPKGVMINQQGMLNHLYAKIEDLQLQPQDCVAQNASSNFDISVWQMWAALLQGGRVHLFSAEEAQQPHQLWRCVREQAITVLQVVPSFLRLLLDELQGKETNVFDPWMHLRLLLATGEALPADLCRRWLQRLPEVPLINAYGPTECSDDVTHAWLKSDSTGFLERVPIGRPLRNTQLYVLDRQMELVPVGVVGELYVGGKGVGRGYLGVPEQTGASFVPDPWSQEPGARLYRTGDLVRYWEDGKLEHIGRVDEQVKLRGYRIELGEIEATLRGLPAIEDAVVLVRDDVADDECLVAYVVGGKHGEMLDEDAIYRELQATLPGYMVPRYLVLLTALPVTTNGKIDRQSLPVPKRRLGESTEQGMVACTPIEEIVLGVYRDVLGVERIGLHENFFHLGGHSLLATQVIARLRGHMHIEIPLRSLFEAPSVAGLAQRIESMLRREEARSLPPLVPISREQDIPLSFAQERLWFLQQLEPDSSAYQVSIAFRLSGPLSVEVFSRCLQTMVQRHESLRTTFVMGLERPIQVINAHLHVNVPVIDLQEVTEDKQSLAVSQWIRDARHHPFDLESGPLMRVSLFHIGKDEYVFSVVMPHIVMDEWAASVFLREFPLMYEAMLQDKPAPLAPLKFQYADFAFWQRNWLQGETLKALIEYWTEQLRGAVPLELPTDRARTQAVSNRGAMYSFKLRKQLVQILRAFSRQEGVTLFMTLLNALLIVLYHSTGQQDLVVGTDIADRRMRETEDMIGFFINLLVVRLRLSVQATFRETLKSLCSVMLDSYAHQDLPFEKLVEELQLNREPGHVPLVNVLFVFENVPPRTFELPGLMVSQVETNSLVNAAKFDVALFLVEEGQELLGSVNYRTDLFEPGTIERLVHHFEVLLQDSMANPDIPLEMLEMLTTEEKDQRMHESNIYMQKQRNRLKSAKRRVVALSTDGEKS